MKRPSQLYRLSLLELHDGGMVLLALYDETQQARVVGRIHRLKDGTLLAISSRSHEYHGYPPGKNQREEAVEFLIRDTNQRLQRNRDMLKEHMAAIAEDLEEHTTQALRIAAFEADFRSSQQQPGEAKQG